MIDRTAWIQKEVPPKPKPASNKIMGIGIVLAGGVVLAVALIIGLEFPRHVREKVKDDQCILSETHHKFEEWSEDQFYSRYNRIYYWVITNRDGFLFHGESPKTQQHGPYVYKTINRKVDVKFHGKTLSYAIMTSHQYQSDLTRSECGGDCEESDQLTVVNTNFMRKITEFQNDENFIYTLLPKRIEQVVAKLRKVVEEEQLFSVLGAFKVEDQNATNLLEELSDYAFGAWIGRNDTHYKERIMDSRNQSSFSAAEMKAFYSVLLQQTPLGVTKSQLISLSEKNTCISPLHMALTSQTNATMCGMLYYVKQSVANFTTIQNNTDAVMSLLCTSSDKCFDIMSNQDTTIDYLQAFYYFVLHLHSILTEDDFLSQNNIHLTVTKPQRELALGYYGTELLGYEFVSGILTQNGGNKESLETMDRVFVKSCLDTRDISTNMKLTGYRSLRLNFYTNSISGYSDFTPVSTFLKACVPCVSSTNSLPFFIADLRRDIMFRRTEDTTNYDVEVARFIIALDEFMPGKEGVSTAGLLDVSSYISQPSWFSTPHFYGFEHNITSLASDPDADHHQSVVEVEHVTGRVWKKAIRLQFNVGLEEQRLKAFSSTRMRLTYYRLPIPVYWVEHFAEIIPLQVQYFHNKVTRLMRVSCGGLIGISIIAVVVVAIGGVITFVPLGLGRVSPMPADVELYSR